MTMHAIQKKINDLITSDEGERENLLRLQSSIY